MNTWYEHYILAFGPHPDDVEVGCGWVLRQSAQQGKKNLIVDCSLSQYSTHGDGVSRSQEAQQAAKILWVDQRINLGLHDTQIIDDQEHRKLIATLIRRHRPEIVLVPSMYDRHPDHSALPHLVQHACFYAGLAKIDLDGLPVHRPRILLQYMIREAFDPDIIVGLSVESFDAKMSAFQSFHSQKPTNEHAFNYLKWRATTLGFAIRQPYGEWFKTFGDGVGVMSFDDLVTGYW